MKLATTHDIKTIQQLAQNIWPLCYGDIISVEQISYMLELIYNDAALKTQMEEGHKFIIAHENDKPIGFASFSEKSSFKQTTFRLHKLYVLTTLHTKGIGSFLLNYICNESKKAGGLLLELNVNKNNPAITFYERNGFNILKEEIIDIGGGYIMDDYVMVKPL